MNDADNSEDSSCEDNTSDVPRQSEVSNASDFETLIKEKMTLIDKMIKNKDRVSLHHGISLHDFFILAWFLNDVSMSRLMKDELNKTIATVLSMDIADCAKIFAYGKKAGTTGEMLMKCKAEGIHSKDDLYQIVRRQWHVDHFTLHTSVELEVKLDSKKTWAYEKKMAKDEIRKAKLDKTTEKKEVSKRSLLMTFHTTLSIKTMQDVCATYGVVAALGLSMNLATFASMNINEWELYRTTAAVDRCENEELWFATSNSTQECARELASVLEFFFVTMNALASSFLLLCVVMSSGIFIAIGFPNVHTSRPEEEMVVVDRFMGEFTALNVLFLFCIFASSTGLVFFMQLKISSSYLVQLVMLIASISGVGLIGVILWLCIEVKRAKDVIEHLRRKTKPGKMSNLQMWKKFFCCSSTRADEADECLPPYEQADRNGSGQEHQFKIG